MLRAFLDETESHHGKERLTGVAAFVFDDEGYRAFLQQWNPRVRSLKERFHLAACYGGYGQFGEPPWDRDARERLWKELGELIVQTRLAGFFCFITQADYDGLKDTSPSLTAYSGSAYSLCLLHCAFGVADFAKKANHPNIFYTFESGASKMNEARNFMRRAAAHKKVKSDLHIADYAFAEKLDEPALASADYLAWAGQRMYMEYLNGADNFHPVFDLLRRSGSLHSVQLTPASIFRQALFNKFYQLHADQE